MPEDGLKAHFRLSAALLERLDAIADAWGVSRSGALRRLIERAHVPEAGEPLDLPDLDELLRVAGERARKGNVAAMNFLVSQMPAEREHTLDRLLERLGAGDR
jgi:hypothetical protein